MAARVGVDLVPYGRVRAMVRAESPALRHMLSADEKALSTNEFGPDIAGIAGRLAAKEAVFKVLRTPDETVPWSTTEILRGAGGWPEVRLSGRAAALASEGGIEEISVSITHDGEYAIAVAFTVPSQNGPAQNGPAQNRQASPTGGCDHECCHGKSEPGAGLDPAQTS